MATPSTALRRVSAQTLADVVAERLTAAILNGELEPGERVSELDVATKLGLSRGPIREALRRLETQGLITIVPYKGATVTTLATRDAYEVYTLAAVAEGLALRLAIDRVTPAWLQELRRSIAAMREAATQKDLNQLARADLEFGDSVFARANHVRLQRLWNHQLKYQSFFLTRAFVPRVHKRLEEFVETHVRIVELLRRREDGQLEVFLRQHMEEVVATFHRFLVEDGVGLN